MILERLEFIQLRWEVAGSLMWAVVGLWKAERSSPCLGREACWIIGQATQVNGEEESAEGQ